MTFKRFMLYALGAMVLVIGVGAAWMFGPALMPPQPIDAGIRTGAKAPVAMELRTADGQPTSLASQMGERGLVLLLVRSADWCPFCKAQLKRTEEIAAQIRDRKYALAALSYDDPAKLARFATEAGLSYPLLSDTGSRMIDALGLRDPQYEEGSYAWGVPRASVLVLAPDGTVQARYVAADYRSRPSNDDVLELVDRAAR